MLNKNLKNEKLKKQFYDYKINVDGASTESLKTYKLILRHFDNFTKNADYEKFNKNTAINYKKWLAGETGEKDLAYASQYTCLRKLQDFFNWLSEQKGYKSKITKTDIKYLDLENNKKRAFAGTHRKEYPTLDEVLKLVKSIKGADELAMRDRALVSFLLMSGMRDTAIASLPLKCFDENTLIIKQYPCLGVKTKFRKNICSVLFKFSDELLGYVIIWVKYLREVKHFTGDMPLFPKSESEQDKENKMLIPVITNKFWGGSYGVRQMLKRRCNNAGLKYYPPHAYRHAAVNLAISRCKTGTDLKAVSQSLGHEHIGTTFQAYGKLTDEKIVETISSLDFTTSNTEDTHLQQCLEYLVQHFKKEGNF